MIQFFLIARIADNLASFWSIFFTFQIILTYLTTTFVKVVKLVKRVILYKNKLQWTFWRSDYTCKTLVNLAMLFIRLAIQSSWHATLTKLKMMQDHASDLPLREITRPNCTNSEMQSREYNTENTTSHSHWFTLWFCSASQAEQNQRVDLGFVSGLDYGVTGLRGF